MTILDKHLKSHPFFSQFDCQVEKHPDGGVTVYFGEGSMGLQHDWVEDDSYIGIVLDHAEKMYAQLAERVNNKNEQDIN
jgi:hypothetical protein